ncbi:MAG: hypothetical protein Q4A63_04015 [Butyricicoccus pullicaecorum]|nr:hypothetical protein [Butyricicoccus pullicaecorum]
MTKKQLLTYIYLRREIENQQERLSRYPAYESEIVDKMENIRKEMSVIRAAIDALKSPMEREVLRLRYCDGDACRHMPWREVALNIYGDDDERQMQAVYRLHGRALQNIREIEA